MDIGRFIAAGPAVTLRGESKGVGTKLSVAHVRRLSETADVWDLTVPGVGEFSLANGAVVHNSDAFGLMCVAYETPAGRPKALKYPALGIA